jgi:mycothiol system anti-sigma-R factor
MNCDEAQELITALVDNELSHLERPLIEGHLKDCSGCARAYEQEQSLKKEIQTVAANMSAPADLRRKILVAQAILRKEPEASRRWNISFRPLRQLLYPAFGVAVLLIVVLATIYQTQPDSQPISLAALQSQLKIVEGELPLRKMKNHNELRDWQTRAVNGKFAPMEYELSSLQLVGGTVQEINGRKILVTLYAWNNMSVTCFTFIGTEQDAPKEAAIFFDQGTKFYTFTENGYNAVLHLEGHVICILVSKMPLNDLLSLARKANPA